MPQLIAVGAKMFRINPVNNTVEYSYGTNGAVWVKRGIGSKFGRLKDLLWFNNKLFLLADTGIYQSRNEGADWGCTGSGWPVENMVALMDGGQYMYGLTSDGRMWASNNEGACWGCRGGVI